MSRLLRTGSVLVLATIARAVRQHLVHRNRTSPKGSFQAG